MLILTIGTISSDAAPQDAPDPVEDAAPEQAASAVKKGAEAPRSREQGQAHIDDSFREHVTGLHEERSRIIADTKIKLTLRTYYLDQDRFDDSEREAWAVGGSLGGQTGYLWDRLSIGATGFTSQPLYAPDEKDGTLLLQPGGEQYTVLGEAFGDLRIFEGLHVIGGRKAYDTPFINRQDNRMTPNTFEAYVLQGHIGKVEDGQFKYGFGYFDKIKPRNEDQFISMSRSAGASVTRGVFSGGGRYTEGGFSIGAINYFSEDVLNIFYAESKIEIPNAEHFKPTLALQFIDQRNVGSNALTGSSFNAQHFGVKTDMPFGPALVTLAYTQLFGNSSVRSPWGGYPGWTSVQVQDFNREGEGAFMIRVGYDFSELLHGLSAYALCVIGTDPDPADEYRQNEYDFNLQWAPTEGPLKNLSVRLRYAIVEQFGGDVNDLTDFRVIVDYSIPF